MTDTNMAKKPASQARTATPSAERRTVVKDAPGAYRVKNSTAGTTRKVLRKVLRDAKTGKFNEPSPEPAHVVHRPTIGAYRALLRNAALAERIEVERQGVPGKVVSGLMRDIATTAGAFGRITGIPKATFTKKMARNEVFAGASGQSIVGLIDLINRVEAMVQVEGETPETQHFDAAKWVGEWIQRPQPALGGVTPAELMDTPSGRDAVMRLLGAIQSGAYQ